MEIWWVLVSLCCQRRRAPTVGASFFVLYFLADLAIFKATAPRACSRSNRHGVAGSFASSWSCCRAKSVQLRSWRVIYPVEMRGGGYPRGPSLTLRLSLTPRDHEWRSLVRANCRGVSVGCEPAQLRDDYAGVLRKHGAVDPCGRAPCPARDRTAPLAYVLPARRRLDDDPVGSIVGPRSGQEQGSFARREVANGQSLAEPAVLVVSLVAGALLMAQSLRSAGYSWVGWVALFPLFISIRVRGPVGSLLCGGVWGVALYVFLVLGSGGAAAPGVISLALLTSVTALYACLAAWLTERIGFSPFVLGVGWMAVDLAVMPLGLARGWLTEAQADLSVLYVTANYLGYVFIALLAAYTAALLVALLDCVPIPAVGRRVAAASANVRSTVFPQTFSCFPLLIIPPSRARAPPVNPMQ